MYIKRILTNNAIVVEENNGEKIICGKGIAYKKKNGQEFDPSLIERTFILENDGTLTKFEQLLKDVPIEYIRLAYDIITMSKQQFSEDFNDSMIVTLSDHIYVAVNRFREGITISNPMIYDIKQFYANEYNVGLKALEMIEKTLNVKLPEDEAGFIALHIVSAQLDDTNMEYTLKISKFIREVLTIVKYYYGVTLDTESVYYYRFITHLKTFAIRMFSGKQYDDNFIGDLLDLIKNKYKDAYQCALAVKDYIRKTYSYELSLDEITYLTIHIERMVLKADIKSDQ